MTNPLFSTQPNSTGTSHVDSRGGTRGHAHLCSHQGGEINSAISGKIKLHRKLRNDLENMKITLESVEAVLSDAERESIKHKSMLLWLNWLKDAANDISDMLEDFEDETDLNLWAATMKKIKMPRTMRSMQKRLQKIKEDRDCYGVQPETRCEERQVPDIWETAGYVEEA